jgi:hypothetical protein
MTYDLMGDHASALAEAQTGVALEPAPLIMAVMGYEYGLLGNRDEAQKSIARLS